jgi:tetratricopeptide (TPR) repeat protein
VQRKLDAALAQFDELTRKKPGSVAAHTMVAMILETQQKTQEAEARYETILQLDPNAAVASNNLAYMYAERRTNLDRALGLAQTAKQRLPDNAAVNDTLGWVFYQKGLATMAVRPPELSVAREPGNPLYQYHLGLAYYGAGQLEKARRTLEESLRLKPDFEGAADARKILDTLKTESGSGSSQR